MPKQVIIKHPDWWKVVTAKKKPEHLAMKGPQPFELAIELPKEAMAALEKDPLLQARMWEPAQEQWKALNGALVAAIGSADGTIRHIAEQIAQNDPYSSKKDIVKTKAEFFKKADELITKYKGRMEKGVLDAWAKIQKEKEDLKDYKIKVIATSVFRAAFVLVSGISVLASGGTSGLGWYALYLQTVKGAKDLYAHNRDLEKLFNEISKDINALDKDIKKALMAKKLKGSQGKLIANTITLAALGTEVSRNVLSVQKKMAIAKGRADKMAQGAHKQAAKINKLLAEVNKDSKNRPPKVKKAYDELCKKIDDMLVLIENHMALAEDIKSHEKVWTSKLKKLEEKQSAKAIMVTMKVVVVIAGVARGIAGDLSSDQSAIEGGIKLVGKAGDGLKTAMQNFKSALQPIAA